MTPRGSMRRVGAVLLTAALAPLAVVATAPAGAAVEGSGSLTGTVRWEQGITVEAYRWAGDETAPELVATDLTDSEGDWEVHGLPTGQYVVHFDDESDEYLAEYWKDADTLAEADPVLIDPAIGTQHLDVELTPGARIMGAVTGPEGEGRADVIVTAYRLDPVTSEWVPSGRATTEHDGVYWLRGLRAGTYRLELLDGLYATEFWTAKWWDASQDAHEIGAASDIVLMAGGVAVAKDAQVGTPVTRPDLPELAQTQAVRVFGTPAVGEDYYAQSGMWSPLPERIDYQWLADNVPIPGATGSTYVPVPGDVGKRLRFISTAKRSGYADSTAISPASSPVSAVSVTMPPRDMISPVITGTPRVGATVSLKPGDWVPENGTFTYQWLVDDVAVDGATGLTYTPSPADVDKKLRVAVTNTLDDHRVGVALAPGKMVEPGRITTTRSPFVRGRVERGATLVVDLGAWQPATTSLELQWYAGSRPLPRATSTWLALTGRTAKAVAGERVSVKITLTAPGYAPSVRTAVALGRLAARRALPVANLTPPDIVGPVRVGVPVSVVPGTWEPADSTVTFQWLVDGHPVEGATGPTYTPVGADIDKALRVVETAVRDGRETASVTSQFQWVGPGSFDVTTLPSVDGHVARGETLTIEPGIWSPADVPVTMRIQWYAGRDPIADATRPTLRLTGRTARAAQGKRIRARIHLVALGYSTHTVTIFLPGRVRA